jgi:hypothetical protein
LFAVNRLRFSRQDTLSKMTEHPQGLHQNRRLHQRHLPYPDDLPNPLVKDQWYN